MELKKLTFMNKILKIKSYRTRRIPFSGGDSEIVDVLPKTSVSNVVSAGS